ncbi:hypothetical protein [Streptomyces spectabilis]|uniref:Uncharacterized protein n=1 Tax=Streptomyces spectabilis TaxID=68270 RepID=A0A5P2X9Q3_STRST|nr:hypothetical protein [Streptomyces spectabilis]MBB5103730.1 hypothetical protein [Streptomyces spectabilis]MCI3904028.1 hypothetical protein [Streptomyces spectabilis]QEV61168.1 hypothetical protein CP982_22710 [Streptomyces spectabilis]GGV19135.1 hypothetical protein GCM10010245_32350 [Streptomyces spectabilis]
MEAAGVRTPAEPSGRDAPVPGRGTASRAPDRHAAVVHAIADDLNGRGYPVTWVVDRQLLAGDFPLQVVAKVSVVRVLNIALDVRGDGAAPAVVWRVSMGRPSSVRWEQSAVLDLGAEGLDGERVVREALRSVGLPLQRAI